VTGAGGSIGSELCRQIVKNSPTKLVLFELSEFALYAIEKELSEFCAKNDLNIEILPILGSIQNKKLVESTFSTFSVQTVYHAAAYKHVPLVEHNVVEGVRNNVYGTYNLATAAIYTKVETFVLISTDKAVRPTNIMGTTKRMAELVLQGLSEIQDTTRFTMVRFGNVLGSSGSVVPLFRKQIKAGGPITLTHQDITRYFMTIPEAAQLVIQAGAMGVGSDVFVLDMGEPVKIKDLAIKMVHLSGLEVKHAKRPNGDIEIQCTGLRPGEKLFEELLIGDNVIGTDHPRILSAQEIKMPWSELSPFLDKLKLACDETDHQEIRRLLLTAPTAFSPTDGICDLNWKQKFNNQTNVTVLPNVSGS
ncbi:UDP-N-acetylglucosamine 4,6-dehydratase family protein, partial [Pseudoalteromonas sp. AC163]